MNLLEEILIFIQKGNLVEAKKICEFIINKEPSNSQALHLLGLIKYKECDYKVAELLISKAILINPNNSSFYSNLGHVLRKLKKKQDALFYYDKAISLKPDYAEAYYNRGIIFKELNRIEDALSDYDKAISLKPDYAEAYHNRGIIFKELNRIEDALSDYDKAISLKLDSEKFYCSRGVLFSELNRIEDALSDYDKAISLKPDYAEAYHNRGIIFKELNRIEDALSDYDKAISLKPDYAEAYHNRGIIFKELNRIEDALSDYDKAISLKLDSEKFYCSRGVLFSELNRIEDALSDYDKAISLKPDYAEAYHNRGIIFKELNRIEDALSDYDKAISLKPDYVEFYWNKSLILLLKGDYINGFKLYEKRWNTPSAGFFNFKNNFSKPFWDGEQSLKNKNILLLSEQGLGDTIQFCRYIELVKSLGATVLFQVPKKLLGLLKSLKCVDHFLIEGDVPPKYDYYCTLLSLPFAFKTEIKTIPCNIPYLTVSEEKINSWKNYLGSEHLKIAISWQGGKSSVDTGRSFPLKLFRNISNIPGVRLISLQKNEGIDQLIDANLKIQVLPNNFDDKGEEFLDSAAVMKSVDLVITSDTSLTHLAGALGINTWLALKYVPDWRWLMDRIDSPWYAYHRLFRQKKINDWEQVFLNMEKEIRSLLEQ